MYILTSDDTKSYPYFFVWSFIKQVSLVGQQEGQLAVRLKELLVSTERYNKLYVVYIIIIYIYIYLLLLISGVSSDLLLTFPFQHDSTTSFIKQ